MDTEQSPEPERNNVRLFVQASIAARLEQRYKLKAMGYGRIFTRPHFHTAWDQ